MQVFLKTFHLFMQLLNQSCKFVMKISQILILRNIGKFIVQSTLISV